MYRLLLTIRAVIFSIWLAVTTVVYASAIFLGFCLPYRYLFALKRSWSYTNLFGLRLICGVDYFIKGKHNWCDKPLIVMSKHQSTMETMILAAHLPNYPAWVIKKELLSVPFFGWAFKRFKPIAIDRNAGKTALQQVVEQGTKVLQQGRWITIFPEGSRAVVDKPTVVKKGGAVLAEATGFPIMPVAVNTGYFWSHNHFIKTPGTATISFGPLISPKGKSVEQIQEEVRLWIEREIQQLK